MRDRYRNALEAKGCGRMTKLPKSVREAVEAAGPDILQLPFAKVGCVLHKRHDPDPSSSELHHVYPLYLQKQRWPDVDPQRPATAHDRERVPACPTGHVDIHRAIDALLDKRQRPKGVGLAETKLAGEAILRHQS
jgi:hypothetical protein